MKSIGYTFIAPLWLIFIWSVNSIAAIPIENIVSCNNHYNLQSMPTVFPGNAIYCVENIDSESRFWLKDISKNADHTMLVANSNPLYWLDADNQLNAGRIKWVADDGSYLFIIPSVGSTPPAIGSIIVEGKRTFPAPYDLLSAQIGQQAHVDKISYGSKNRLWVRDVNLKTSIPERYHRVFWLDLFGQIQTGRFEWISPVANYGYLIADNPETDLPMANDRIILKKASVILFKNNLSNCVSIEQNRLTSSGCSPTFAPQNWVVDPNSQTTITNYHFNDNYWSHSLLNNGLDSALSYGYPLSSYDLSAGFAKFNFSENTINPVIDQSYHVSIESNNSVVTKKTSPSSSDFLIWQGNNGGEFQLQFVDVNYSSLCMGVNLGLQKNYPITLNKCKYAEASQLWLHDKQTQQIRSRLNPAYCLTVQGTPVLSSGSLIMLTRCQTDNNGQAIFGQSFELQNLKLHIKNEGIISDFVVDVDSINPNAPVIINIDASNNYTQQWLTSDLYGKSVITDRVLNSAYPKLESFFLQPATKISSCLSKNSDETELNICNASDIAQQWGIKKTPSGFLLNSNDKNCLAANSTSQVYTDICDANKINFGWERFQRLDGFHLYRHQGTGLCLTSEDNNLVFQECTLDYQKNQWWRESSL